MIKNLFKLYNYECDLNNLYKNYIKYIILKLNKKCSYIKTLGIFGSI